MARLSLLLLGLSAAPREASAWWQYEGQYGTIPSEDRCGADCENICIKGLGRSSWDAWMSCKKTCTAHSIQTKSSKGIDQGKYLQKVMTEYCQRGVCGASGVGLIAERAEVERHDVSGEKWWGAPAATTPKPIRCATKEFYCGRMCSEMYHPVMSDLGPHAGTENPKVDKPKCESDCRARWTKMEDLWKTYCACTKAYGAPTIPARLLQTPEAEEVDVGSFMQERVEVQQPAREL